MIREFKSPNQFNEFFQSKYKTNPIESRKIVSIALTEAAEFLKEKAKEKFGHYQTGWDQLADATQQDRIKKGYTPNDPLLRDGTLKESVTTMIEGNNAFIGSTEQIMVWQEKGTTKTGWGKGIPPRPVFLLTQIQDGKQAVSIFFNSFIKKFSGL